MPTIRTLRSIVVLSVAMAVLPASAGAQRVISAQLGVGSAVDARQDRLDRTVRHASGGVELAPPFLPVAIRAEGLWVDTPGPGGTAAVTANGVFLLPLPVIRPYAVAGYRQYGVGGSNPTNGFNAGAGVRIPVGGVRLFGEVRRHWPLSRDFVTLGVAL